MIWRKRRPCTGTGYSCLEAWKDTIYLPIREAATFIARFDETADASFPFMYHCHMVNHEDGGLMGQFTVY